MKPPIYLSAIALRSGLLLLITVVLSIPANADTYTVSNTGDSGAGSLRQAIQAANARPGMDQIVFNIPGAGIHTISLAASLPDITDPITIDGYTQPGARANTDSVADNAILLIELNGSQIGF